MMMMQLQQQQHQQQVVQQRGLLRCTYKSCDFCAKSRKRCDGLLPRCRWAIRVCRKKCFQNSNTVRGTILNRTYTAQKNLYVYHVYHVLPTRFGSIYFGPPHYCNISGKRVGGNLLGHSVFMTRPWLPQLQ